jgi:SAM-dependent MidA family methyltransferase
MQTDEGASLSAQLQVRIRRALRDSRGWLPFDEFMRMALYEPGLGYYANARPKFGSMPALGSDFVTAPELSPLFGRALAVQVSQALTACESAVVWEFGAGSGALAAQLLGELGDAVAHYGIVELSSSLRHRQQEALQPWAGRVHWHQTLPERIDGVVIGNELLDAMPVQLLHWTGEQWLERGVADDNGRFVWSDRPTRLRPPVDGRFVAGSVVEIHRQAQAFVRTLAAHLSRGVALFVDYGFPEAEYYHPQRIGGTLLCHRAHRVDDDPLSDVGLKDITAHVDFSGIALAGQDAGFDVLGYTSQARFLLNCGITELLRGGDVRAVSAAQKLINEHEMGELFKVIGFARDTAFDAIGFRHGDRSHRL